MFRLSAESRDGDAELEMSKECYKLISYADLNDIIFGLSVYLPVILTLIIFTASYNQFTKVSAVAVSDPRASAV